MTSHKVNECDAQRSEARSQDRAAQTLAEKFKISPDKAKRLIELYRAAVAREAKNPKGDRVRRQRQ
jgi:hypothetical protein